MKSFVIIATIFLSFSATAQLIKTNEKKWNRKEVLDKINDSTAYFLDTIRFQRSQIKQVNSSDIAAIKAYFEEEPDLPIIFKPYIKYGVISFVTKRHAISIYRSQLANISNDYAKLTSQHPMDQDSLLYIVEGDTLKPNVEGKLMDLKFVKINNIQILFPEEAQRRFGDRAKLGAVLIYSRKD